jgi:DNA processing protein
MGEHEAALVMMMASGLGPVTSSKLVAACGSYGNVVSTVCRPGARPVGLPPSVAAAIRTSASSGDAKRQLARAREIGARFAISGDDDYPELLEEISDPPVGLFVLGDAVCGLLPMVAVVGTRSPTPRGASVAHDLAFDLAGEGITVVSGLARGIDTAAHRGAIEAGGHSVAVLGSGIDQLYPRENAGLAGKIVGRGAVVSEFPMGQEPRPGSFPRRNRIIAGLSIGTVVVEAGIRSGALITASRALEQGREVFAVPGPVDEPQSRGPNGLIKGGAKLVEDVRDVIEELEGAWGPLLNTAAPRLAGAAAPSARQSRGGAGGRDTTGDRERPAGGQGECTGLKGRILAELTMTPAGVDELAARTSAPVASVLAALLELELAGKARSWPGGRFTAAGGRRPSRQE